MSNLRETFINELRDIYDAEKQLLKALPKMAKAASNEELRTAFEEHLEETEGQIERLEEVFKILDMPARGKKCAGMQGLIEEGSEMIEEEEGDAALICAAQKVEHYEIATYGSLVSWANLLEEDDASALLEESLHEEEQTDERLTELAETLINVEEAQGDGKEEEEEAAGARGKKR